MSRSYNKNTFSRNFMTHGRASEKKDKKDWHQKFRRVTKQLCQENKEQEEFTANHLPVENEISNPYAFSKDGKHYVSQKDLRDLKNELPVREINKNLKFRK